MHLIGAQQSSSVVWQPTFNRQRNHRRSEFHSTPHMH